MTTYAISFKKEESKLEFTKAKIIPKNLYLLSDPENNDEMKIEKFCIDGNIFNLMDLMDFDTPTFISTNKWEKKIINSDKGYIIPLNVDGNIKTLVKKKNNKKFFRIDKSNNHNNYYIYQWINNELYVLVSVVKNYFLTEKSKELYYNLNDQLQYISERFKNTIIKVNENKYNKRNTYSIYGGCSTMQGHPNYPYPTKSERYCHVAEYIFNYILKKEDNDFKFEMIHLNEIFADFKYNKKFNEKVEIKKDYFTFVLKDKEIYNFYLYLKDHLFHLITKLSFTVSSLIQNQFPKLYENFNDINLSNIETSLSLFKSFVINFNVEKDDNNSIRQGAVDVHKDNNDVLYAFCVIVVFGNFEGGDLILSEIGISLEIEDGYIVLLRSALLEHFNSKVKGSRWSIVFYLRKDIFNEK